MLLQSETHINIEEAKGPKEGEGAKLAIVQLLSCDQLFVTLQTAAGQAPLSSTVSRDKLVGTCNLSLLNPSSPLPYLFKFFIFKEFHCSRGMRTWWHYTICYFLLPAPPAPCILPLLLFPFFLLLPYPSSFFFFLLSPSPSPSPPPSFN